MLIRVYTCRKGLAVMAGPFYVALLLICFLHSIDDSGSCPLWYGAVFTIKDAHPVEGGDAIRLGLFYYVGSLVGSSFYFAGSTVLTDSLAAMSTIFANDAGYSLAYEMVVQSSEYPFHLVTA